MNLFESQIATITTPDNAIYMEAVGNIFNTLFEEQIGELTETESSGNDNNLVSTLHSYLSDIASKAGGIAKGNEYLATNVNNEALSSLNALVKNNFASPYDLYHNGVKLVNELIDAAKIVNKDQFKKNLISNHVNAQAIKDFIEYKKTLNAFAETHVKEFSPENSPEMFTAPKKSKPKSNGSYIKNGTFTSDSTPTETDSAKPSAKTKASSTTPKEKPEEVDPGDDPKNRSFIDADITDTYTTANEIVFENVEDMDELVSYLQDAFNSVLKVKGKYNLSSAYITIDKDPKNNLVLIEYKNPGNSDFSVDTRHNVVMYCLYMDAKKHGKVSNAVISDPLAHSLASDYAHGSPTLIRLLNMYNENSYKEVNIPSMNQLMSYLENDSLTDDSNAQLAAAITSYFETFDSADLDSLNLQNERQMTSAENSFYNTVSQIASSMSEGEDIDLEGESNKEEFLNALRSANIFSEIISKMKTNAGNSNGDNATFSYNEGAAKLVDSCRQANHYYQTNSNRYGSPSDDVTDLSNDELDDITPTASTAGSPVTKRYDVTR